MEKSKDNELDLISLFKILYAKKLVIVVFTTVFMVFGLLYAFTATPVYTVKTSIIPSEDMSSGNALSGLQNLSGALPFLSSMQNSSIASNFPDILESKRLLMQLLGTSFTDSEGKTATLLEHFDIKVDDEKLKLERAYISLERSIDVEVDNTSQLVVLYLNSKDPKLAADTANRLIGMLNDYTVEFMTESARKTREFAEDQLAIQMDSLEIYEEKIKEFASTNKLYRQSPILLSEYRALERERIAWERLWIDYRTQVGMAKFQEVKDTPVITVLDEAIVPVKPSKPNKLLILVISMIMGGVFGFLKVLISFKLDESAAA